MSLTTCRRVATSNSPAFICGSSRQSLRPNLPRPRRGLSVQSSSPASETVNNDPQEDGLREGIQSDITEFEDYLDRIQTLQVQDDATTPASPDWSMARGWKPRAHHQRNVIVFRPHESIRTMPMALAILQEAEARFGKAVEFKFPKDKEISSMYYSFFYAKFKDLNETDKPIEPFPTEIPYVDLERLRLEGNVGLADILPFLRPKEVGKDQNSPDPSLQESQTVVDESSTSGEIESQTTLSEEQVSDFENGEETAPESVDSRHNAVGDRIVYTRAEHSKPGNWQFVNLWKPPLGKTHGIRVAQNFIKWGGFYPYNYSTVLDQSPTPTRMDEVGASNLGDLSPEFDPEVTEAEKQRWRVKEATGAMVAALHEQRTYLREHGQEDHGMEKVPGGWLIKELVKPSDKQEAQSTRLDHTTQEDDVFVSEEPPVVAAPLLNQKSTPRPLTKIESDSPISQTHSEKADIRTSSVQSPVQNNKPKAKSKTKAKTKKKSSKSTATVGANEQPMEPEATVEVPKQEGQSSSSGQEDVREKLWSFVRQVWR